MGAGNKHNGKTGADLYFMLILAAFAVGPLYAESEINHSASVNLTISSLPEAKLTFSQNFTLPFLQADHFLFADNNVQFNIDAELSPISMNLKGEAVLTPIAFFQAAAGGMIGSGWNIELFGGTIKGIGINRPAANGGAELDGSAFNGVFGEGHLGGALQFDIAAIFPGDWHHVVFRSYHEISYRGYSRASAGDAWFFENDFGENQNSFNYYGNYLIGYQMPIFLDTVALLAEMKKYLYDSPGGSLWGDELGRWEFSAILNFAITKRFSAALITQCRTMRNYTAATQDFEYYRERRLDNSAPLRFEFYRVAAIASFKIYSTKE